MHQARLSDGISSPGKLPLGRSKAEGFCGGEPQRLLGVSPLGMESGSIDVCRIAGCSQSDGAVGSVLALPSALPATPLQHPL